MRIVCDTNVFISAGLKSDSWPATVVNWVGRHGRLLKSVDTEAELLRVLARPRLAARFTTGFDATVRNMLATAEPVTITRRFAVCRDPKDDKFLDLSVAGQADVLISGDADLLVLGRFWGVPVLAPARFAFLHTASSP